MWKASRLESDRGADPDSIQNGLDGMALKA